MSSLPHMAALVLAAIALLTGIGVGVDADDKTASLRICRVCSWAGAGAMVFIIGADMSSGFTQASLLVAGITGLVVFFGGAIVFTRKLWAKRWLLTGMSYGLTAAGGVAYTPTTDGMFFFALSTYLAVALITPIITLIIWPREVTEEQAPNRGYMPISEQSADNFDPYGARA